MKNNYKKILIVVCLLVIFLGVYVLVKPYGMVKYVTVDSFEYTKTEDGLVLTKYTGEQKNIIIPDNIDGNKVVSLSGTFCGNNVVENVIISEGIKTIDYMAFWHCINLVSVEIPESVETIGHAAFNSCISLKKVKGEFYYSSIMPYAFENCAFLESIILPETLVFIGENAFADCSKLKSVIIPESVEVIGGTTPEKKVDSLGNMIVSDDQRGSTKKTAFDGCKEITVTIDGNNKYYYCENNVIKSKVKH